jgi:HAE1 family hydrophobic/amphiphilic exporter-1
MNLSRLSVQRGVTFTMGYLIVLGFGLFGLSRLALDLYPDITFPTVLVITGYTGANPEDIETLVTRPIEGAVSTVKGVEEVHSDSKQGASIVQLKFDWSKDMEQAETDVRRQLELIEGYLPDDTDPPLVFAFDPSMQPVVMMMVSGPYPLDELRRLADDEIAPRLERLPGIATVESAGGLEREIHVVLDPIRVAAFGLDVNRVVAAVAGDNLQPPGGYIEQGPLEFAVQAEGKYASVAEIGAVLVGTRVSETGRPEPIRLAQVARIEDSFKETRRVLEVDGRPAVWMMVRKQSGANTVRASEVVLGALDEVSRDLGGQIEFGVIFNQAEFINQSLGNLSTSALLGIGITFLVLLFFLRNIRSALIVASAIPLSIVATFAVMDQASMTLNVLSLAGLALAVGMVVDNGIVVLENIYRMREEGLSGREAAVQGAHAVGMAVTASTLTTVAVFVPVLFVPGIAGVMFRDMAVTICFALLVSLAVARSFVPLAADRLLGTARAERLLARARRRSSYARFRETYGRALDFTLRHRWVVGLAVVGVLAATYLVMRALPTEFILEGDNSFLFVSVEAPEDSNIGRTAELMREVAAKVEEVVPPTERRLVALDAGTGEGFTALFSKGVHSGLLRVPLVRVGQRTRSKRDIEAAVRQALATIPGVTTTVSQPFSMMGEGDIEVRLRGHDLDESRRVGLDLRERLQALPDVATADFSMEAQRPQVTVRFDREKMARLGLSTAAASQALSTAIMGRTAAQYAEGGDEYGVLVRYGREHRQDIEELRRVPLVTAGGALVPLGNVADIRMELGPVNITRLDQERVTRLNLYLETRYVGPDGEPQRKDLRASIDRVTKILDDYPFPDGFQYSIGGSAEDFMDSMRYLALALLVSVLLVYMVMASQFESLREPFIVLFSVPLAGIGVVLMFALSRTTIDVSALIGTIMLAGIVVNNAIVMVDAANQLRDEGAPTREAIAKAGRLRLRPVLLTSITTMMAMLPMALGIGEGSEAWAGLARTVIGGLLSATLLVLFVIPTVYTLFAGKRHEARARAAAAPTGGPPAPAPAP